MPISHYLKIIARGAQGARHLSREHACDLFGQVLDGSISDLEVGAFCIAMRVKGETPEEMAGFLDAVHARLAPLPASTRTLVVLPSYNGARKLPVLTPLLALLLAREGLPVLVHGTATEDSRIFSQNVLAALDVPVLQAIQTIAPGSVAFVPTALLLPGLARLLAVRRTLGLRNSAHSLVKLMNPLAPVGARALVVGSYTHPEYAQSMAATFALTGADALLLRGTEGEPVADARRVPQMDGFVAGAVTRLEDAQGGPLTTLPELPTGADAEGTAALIRAMLDGHLPVPAPIARQVEHILRLALQIESARPAP
ncbi:MAG: DNA-binding protein YbiB [Giesbergeria sp.]|nr:DNA-binding protein YbiB [Giesbergeria sp.]MBP6159384.1 DNA-binding protein YbiB [Giesbergeria sp.]MBP7083160.1 DNA-binding protein YbiB [Giesbergeria sp.]MBP9784990.1 DNA-binding protein YbiB [Giesbergeria sp.]MBP9895237.1 DNA-binding protein YbiB [Giesbergeria sp.]